MELIGKIRGNATVMCGMVGMRTVLKSGLRTGDIWQKGCRRVGTREMGDAVLRAL
jgi:hypothetical protein